MKQLPPPRPVGVRRLLCVANYRTNTGFAWDFIEGLYAGLAGRLARRNVETWVAYPEVRDPPKPLQGTPARWFEHRWTLRDRSGRDAARALVRSAEFDTLYLSDRASWDPGYRLLRRAGVRHIVVHDHTSGERTQPRGLRRLLKRARYRLMPGAMADQTIAVSDFVVARKQSVELLPADRIQRVWNSVVVPECPPDDEQRQRIRERFGIAAGALLVVCVARSHPMKGIGHLLRAFDRLVRSGVVGPDGHPPTLLYMGDGPELDNLRAIHGSLMHRDRMLLAGYVPDADEVVGAGDVAVVPSLWEEAFGLAALEPLARGVPVIASRVGGIPEVVRDGREGLLVPPGDEAALTRAMERLLTDAETRRAMGERGFLHARETFNRESQLDRLEEIFVEEMGL